MRVALNGWFLVHNAHTGTGQYLRALCAWLPRVAPQHEYYVVVPAGRIAEMPSAVRLHPVPCGASDLDKVRFEQILFPRACRALNADAVHVPHWAPPLASPAPFVVTVHDLIPLLTRTLPEYRGGLRVRLYTALVAAATAGASLVLADSEASRQDVLHHLRTRPDKVRTVYLAASERYSPKSDWQADETIRQKASNGKSFVDVLSGKGIIPGIKVDKGTVAVPGFPGEKMTAGLEGLRERLKEYREMGAKFAKWRAVVMIGKDIPTQAGTDVNAQGLALYAAMSQEAGLVPIVEPEVLMDGDHDIERCWEVTAATIANVFAALREYRVVFEGMLLKPNMIVSGKQSVKQAGSTEVADTTIRCLRQVVPAAVPGIVFLSGGQSPELATEHLNLINTRGPHPWEMSFSFGRALQDPALRTWRGSAANVAAAQRQFYHRARCNSAARYGTYSNRMEKIAA